MPKVQQVPLFWRRGGPNGGVVSLTLNNAGQAGVHDSVYYQSGIASVLNGTISVMDQGGRAVAITGSTSRQGLLGYELDENGGLGAAQAVVVPGLTDAGTSSFASSDSGFVYVASSAGAVGCFRPDAQGQDRLTGGAGADVFMLEADGVRDAITDFQVGVDRIDLTLVPMLYSAGQLTIESTSWGARLLIRGEELQLHRAGGGTLSENEILAALSWETGRVHLALPEEYRGNESNNELVGASGSDILRGLGGADLLQGLAGDDQIEGGAGSDTLQGDAGQDNLSGGDENDVLDGGADNDTLTGGDGNDTLRGGSGNDRIEAQTGNDLLFGGGGPIVLFYVWVMKATRSWTSPPGQTSCCWKSERCSFQIYPTEQQQREYCWDGTEGRYCWTVSLMHSLIARMCCFYRPHKIRFCRKFVA